MDIITFVILWGGVYTAAWWGGPIVGAVLSRQSATGFNFVRAVLAFLFFLLVFTLTFIRSWIVYAFDGLDPGPPIGGGAVISAILFFWRLGVPAESHPPFMDSKASPIARDIWTYTIPESQYLEADQVHKTGRPRLAEPYNLTESMAEDINPGEGNSEGSESDDEIQLLEENAFLQAGKELTGGNKDPAIWAKALTQSATEFEAHKRYVQLRVESLKSEWALEKRL